jgi:sterol 3beta-glucosyltransferase
MNILILTYGSRGDVQPYVALGAGLRRAGHDVTLATSERFRDFVSGHGLRYGFLSDDLLAIVDTEQGREMIENTKNVFQIVRRMLSMAKQVGPMQRALLEDSWRIAEAVRPDVVVFHPKAFGGPVVAEELGVPVILALPIPMLVPTGEHTNMGFPALKLGAWYNRMTFVAVGGLMALAAGKHVKAWRKAHGLAAQKRLDLLHTADGRDIAVLHAVSRHVMPEPADWPPTAHMTGYWFLDDAQDGAPSDALSTFLNAGPPPVYVGFGSMAGRDPERLGKIVVEALRRANVRGVIATGWGGLKPESLPDTMLKIDQAPHDWLFPRMAAIVHHGGAGTTAAALRAGKPAVIVPFFGDQPVWGRRIFELGAGAAPIPQKKLTAENLGAAISRTMADAKMQARARELGEKIRAEDGVGTAVALIERYAAAV